MFVLTRQEKRVVCFVLLVIVIGLGVKEYRHTHPSRAMISGPAKHASKASTTRKVGLKAVAASRPTDAPADE